jgi:hypothetical protein
MLTEVLVPTAPDIDVVVPVYNEETALAASIHRLHAFLEDGFPFSWRKVTTASGATLYDLQGQADALLALG